MDDLSFSLQRGGRLGVLGLSGSGKSLTALALLGLLPPSATLSGGKAVYTLKDGTSVDLLSLGERDWSALRGREIGLVFQEPLTALNPVQRIGDQLMEAVRFLCPELASKTERTDHLKTWLTRVELPEEQDRILNAYPHELSGGQRQRILIALALLGTPRLLIADEPTTALDTVTELGILSLIRRLSSELNMTLLFITHDLKVIQQITDQAIVLAAGKLQHAGTTEDVLALPGAGLLTASGGDHLPEHEPIVPPLDLILKTAFSVADLSVNYIGERAWPWSEATVFSAVRDVSFTVNPSELVALVGPSGCGKSTIARCLAGLAAPASGSFTRNQGIQLVFQDPFSSLNPRHDLRTILGEVLRLQPANQDSPESLLRAVGLTDETFLTRRPAELSGGQRQRVAIARALAANPGLLIADEAVSALDAPLRKSVLDLLDRLRREKGFGLLFITHDLGLVKERADKILIMDDGKIVETGTPERVLNAPASSMGKALVQAL